MAAHRPAHRTHPDKPDCWSGHFAVLLVHMKDPGSVEKIEHQRAAVIDYAAGRFSRKMGRHDDNIRVGRVLDKFCPRDPRCVGVRTEHR